MQVYSHRMWVLAASAVVVLVTSCAPTDELRVRVESECENTFPVDGYIIAPDYLDYGETLPTREAGLPERLSETILYSDATQKTVHSALAHYVPRYQLWSDGEDKSRWIYLPECDVIQTDDQNDWSFPVGTRFFKEFRRDGRRIETRLIQRIGPGPRDFAYASYQWNDEETDAVRVGEAGVINAGGTGHDIPSKQQCLQCHGSHARGGGRPSRGLGFSALQLAHDGDGVTLKQLKSKARLSHDVPETIPIPGDAVDQAALGYLHANCGGCHNPSKDGLPQTDLNFWLEIGQTEVQETGAWKTAVNQSTRTFTDQHVHARIVPGNAAHSSVYYRMVQRGNLAQMPPIGSRQVDPSGTESVRAWIESMP